MTPIRLAIINRHASRRDDLIRLLQCQSEWTIVAECLDVDQAIRELPARRADVVLLDVGPSVASCLEAISTLKRRLDGQVPILVISAPMSGADIYHVLRAGASGYLCEGSSGEDLMRVIREINTDQAPFIDAAVCRQLIQHIQSSAPAIRLGLTTREWQLLELSGKGQANKAIARGLEISEQTVKNHFRNIYRKLGVHSRAEALIRIRGGRDLIDDC